MDESWGYPHFRKPPNKVIMVINGFRGPPSSDKPRDPWVLRSGGRWPWDQFAQRCAEFSGGFGRSQNRDDLTVNFGEKNRSPCSFAPESMQNRCNFKETFFGLVPQLPSSSIHRTSGATRGAKAGSLREAHVAFFFFLQNGYFRFGSCVGGFKAFQQVSEFSIFH